MFYYYKISNQRRKIETVDGLESDLEFFLKQQSTKQNYRSAGVSAVNVLYKKMGLQEKKEYISGVTVTSYLYGVEVVSNPEIPTDFLQNWGELIESPRQVTEAVYKFKVITNPHHLADKSAAIVNVELVLKDTYPTLEIIMFNDEGYTKGSVKEVLDFHQGLQKFNKKLLILKNYSTTFK